MTNIGLAKVAYEAFTSTSHSNWAHWDNLSPHNQELWIHVVNQVHASCWWCRLVTTIKRWFGR